jgi:OFA family oxalate/formate antiporter-like MFS transporter
MSPLSTSGGQRAPVYFGYWLIAAAFVAQFVSVGVQNYVFGAFMTPMTDEFGWSRTEFTLPRTLGQFVMAVTGFVIGAYVDRYGGRPFMLAGTVILGISLLAMSGVETLLQWVLLNGLLLTVGAAMIGNLVVNVTLAKWFVEMRGRAVAFSAMGVSFAGIVLTPVMTLIIDAWGWRTGWQVMAVGSTALILPIAMLMRRAPEDYGLHPDGKSDAQVAAGQAQKAENDFALSLTRREALRTTSFYMLVLAFGLFLITISVMLLQTIPYMTDAGYSRATAALMITVASVPAFLSKPIWGLLLDRLNAKPLAAAGAAITGIAMLIIVFSVQMGSEFWVYSGFFLLGCGWGGMIPLQEVIWASFFGRRYLGAVRSAAMPFSFLISAGAPLAASYYYDIIGNYDGIFLAVAVSNLLSALLLLLIPPPRQGNQIKVL